MCGKMQSMTQHLREKVCLVFTHSASLLSYTKQQMETLLCASMECQTVLLTFNNDMIVLLVAAHNHVLSPATHLPLRH